MKGKAIKLVTPIRLCLIIVTCILFSCNNKEGCDMAIVPTWSLVVSCEVSQGDTVYIINSDVFPLCRFNKYKVSFLDEWVDIESTIRVTPNEIRSNGPDFRCSMEMKDKSIQSNMMDINYQIQQNDGNCNLSPKAVLTDISENETNIDQAPYVAPSTRTTDKAKPQKNTNSFNETQATQSEYVAPVEQIIKTKTPSAKPIPQEVSPSTSNNTKRSYTLSKPVEVPTQSYTESTGLNSQEPNSLNTKPQAAKTEYNEPTSTAAESDSPELEYQKETTIPAQAKVASESILLDTDIPPPPPVVSKTNPESSSENSEQKKHEAQKSQQTKSPSSSVDELESSTQGMVKSNIGNTEKKTLSENDEKEEAKTKLSKEMSPKFSPTKFPTILLNASCESSNYDSGPVSFIIVPKVKMRLNKLSLYSKTESSINISISGGYNGLIKNRVLLPTGKSEVGMSGFSTFLEPGTSYTLKISSSTAEKLALQDISLCAKDVQDGPYFSISGSALKFISELKIDIE